MKLISTIAMILEEDCMTCYGGNEDYWDGKVPPQFKAYRSPLSLCIEDVGGDMPSQQKILHG